MSKPRRPSSSQRGYGGRWRVIRLYVLNRDRWTCHWCSAFAKTVDHVVPKAEGGTDQPANLVAACGPCNSARSMAWVRAHGNRGAVRRSKPSGRGVGHNGPTGALAEPTP